MSVSVRPSSSEPQSSGNSDISFDVPLTATQAQKRNFVLNVLEQKDKLIIDNIPVTHSRLLGLGTALKEAGNDPSKVNKKVQNKKNIIPSSKLMARLNSIDPKLIDYVKFAL